MSALFPATGLPATGLPAAGQPEPAATTAAPPAGPGHCVQAYDDHQAAEQAIHALHRSGYDVTQVSLVGRGYHTEEQVVGFYTAGDRIRSWGARGAFWGGIWGLLMAPAVFVLPGLGLMAMAGPFVTALVGALEGAALVGGLSALGAALTRIGVPPDQVIRYEADLRADKFLLMVHGNDRDLDRARSVLKQAHPDSQPA